jgi:hypothetical protein
MMSSPDIPCYNVISLPNTIPEAVRGVKFISPHLPKQLPDGAFARSGSFAPRDFSGGVG